MQNRATSLMMDILHMGKTRKGLRYNPKDHYFNEAKKQGFVARSAFKLEEIDKKHKLFTAGMRILDLGCAPGSWLQYAAKRCGPTSNLIGVDLDPVRIDLPNVKTFQGDLTELRADDEHFKDLAPFDMIQSDAMTKTTGIAESDCARSLALVEKGVWLAEQGLLKSGGIFLAKVFEGPDFTPFYVEFKRKFKGCSVNKPDSIREGSREVYILGKEFRSAKS